MAAELAVPPPSKAAMPDDPPAKTSLYVGDLDTQVTERDLVEVFHYFGPLASVRLCRDSHSGKSLCYGYVNFFSNSHASKALDIMNHAEVKGKPVRIMWSQRNPLPRKTGIGNLFVKNLDPSITSSLLQSIFCKFGTILSCKVAEENGKSKGFGFVQFDSEECAMAACGALHDIVVKGKKLYVSKFVNKSNRTTGHEEPNFTNLYVKNLAEDVTEDLLRDKFSRFGKVCSLAIMKNDEGRSKGFGFVNFELPEEAKKAVEVLNGSLLGSNLLFVGKAQKKAEREDLLKHKHNKSFNCYIQKFKASNLYVKNLDISVDESKLQNHFSVCGGKIISVRVMRDQTGISRRFGFVCFSTPEEATKAIDSLNGTILEGRYLYVAFAQSKEERQRGLLNNPISPVHYNSTPYSTLYPLVHWPMMSQPVGTNAGLHYPFVQNYQYHHLSTSDPRRQTRQSDTEIQIVPQNSRNSAYYYSFTPYVDYGNHPTGSRNFV